MDTRTILAAFGSSGLQMPYCYTLGYSREGEYRIARLLAEAVSATHKFIQIADNNYELHWDQKYQLAGGLHHQLQNIFVGLDSNLFSESDVFFHGHGFDYLFQGMYLLSTPITLLKKNTHLKKFTDLNSIKDFSKFYCHKVPYRMWHTDVARYLLQSEREEMLDFLYDQIRKLELESEAFVSNNFDKWEYMMIHAISRHYSQTDVMGMGTYGGKQRKVANDNRLLIFI